MDAASLLDTVRKNLKNIVKIKVTHNKPSSRTITWRLVHEKIYMYDCGDNYATVGMLHDTDELFKEIRKNATDNTESITINYVDESNDIHHFR